MSSPDWGEIRTHFVNMNVKYITKCCFLTFLFILAGQPLSHNPAVPLEEEIWLNDYMKDGREPVSFDRAIYILRRKLFPFMHDPHPWVKADFSKNFISEMLCITPQKAQHMRHSQERTGNQFQTQRIQTVATVANATLRPDVRMYFVSYEY
ncbi:Hypothetical predicted protein [Paramuricea clavata]|uniref:Uncharacterized protein n=1 Tax=Paramuricea clavata TaxID=317549 RepID=A0A6S7ID57_PARCT|nr:Hypothetical predicted protein [Paramuricea clavata]